MRGDSCILGRYIPISTASWPDILGTAFRWSMELTYTKVGDYYIPDLTLGDQPEKALRKYGRMRQKFLEEHHPGTYNRLMLSGKLWAHLVEIDTTCDKRMDNMIPAMMNREGVTEELKASDPMAWVGCMNSIHNRAEELILHELIYVV